MPSTMATTTEANPTTSDRRVPYMIELSTSLPWSSVPSGKVQSPSGETRTGGFSPSLRLIVAGSNGVCGASTGDRKATATISRVTTAATTVIGEDLKLHQTSLSVTRCSQPPGAEAIAMSVPRHTGRAALAAQARIDDEIEQVDDEVDHHEQETDQQQVGRHHRNVGELHGLDEELADARPGEHRLGDDGEGDQAAELQAGHGDHRHQRVLQRMAEIDGAVGEAAGARELDVIGTHHLEHLGAHQAHEQGELEQAERDRGQDQRLQPGDREEVGGPPADLHGLAAPERGQPVQVDREDQDQQDADQEGGERDADQRHRLEQPARPVPGIEAGIDPHRNADEESEGGGAEGKLEGRRYALDDQAADRLGGGGAEAGISAARLDDAAQAM